MQGRFFIPSVAAGLVVALEVARVYLLQPLHLRGVAQGAVSVLLCLSWLLLVPGDHFVDFLRRWPPIEHTFAALDTWRVFLVTSYAIYFVLFYALASMNRGINRRLERKTTAMQPSPATTDDPSTSRPSRRRILRNIKNTVAAGIVVAGTYPLVEPHRLAITSRRFPLRGLPAALGGLRIVQLTDIHLGPWTSVGRVQRIVEASNALEPDIVALTGDYVLRSPRYIPQAVAALAGLRAKVGIVGVLGNHDWYQDGPLTMRLLAGIGVRMIDNDRVLLTPDRRLINLDAGNRTEDSAGLCFAGVGDLWTDHQDYDRALGGLPDEMPRLLLSHNPDVAEERSFISSRYRVDLMLSGHTHGGQIHLPLVGAPVTMSRYGQKYARGLVQGPTCPVYISRGLGMAWLPVRLGSTPEIAVFELRREDVGSTLQTVPARAPGKPGG